MSNIVRLASSGFKPRWALKTQVTNLNHELAVSGCAIETHVSAAARIVEFHPRHSIADHGRQFNGADRSVRERYCPGVMAGKLIAEHKVLLNFIDTYDEAPRRKVDVFGA